jgi:hypothetical protein
MMNSAGDTTVAIRVERKAPPAPRLKACVGCERVWLGGRWVAAERAIRVLRTYESPDLPSFTHGICPACRERRALIRAGRTVAPDSVAAPRAAESGADAEGDPRQQAD